MPEAELSVEEFKTILEFPPIPPVPSLDPPVPPAPTVIKYVEFKTGLRYIGPVDAPPLPPSPPLPPTLLPETVPAFFPASPPDPPPIIDVNTKLPKFITIFELKISVPPIPFDQVIVICGFAAVPPVCCANPPVCIYLAVGALIL